MKIIRDHQKPKVLLMVVTSNMKAKETKKKDDQTIFKRHNK